MQRGPPSSLFRAASGAIFPLGRRARKRSLGIPRMPSSHAKTAASRAYELPPLELLVAFESAARHLSFTRAGDEIALTQSAVSRQILTLAERLGVPLFRRLHRALALTEDGTRFYAATVEALG